MPRATGRLIPRRRRFVAVDEVGDIQTLALGLTRSLDSNLPGDEQAISGRSYRDYMLFRISLVRNFGASHVREMALCMLPFLPPSDTDSHGYFLLDLLHKSVTQRFYQILCHGFHEFARIFLYESAKICEICG